MWKLLGQPGWLCAVMCACLALHIRPHLTTLRTNRNGSWLRCYSGNAQNWYCVTNFLTQPVEPCGRYADIDATGGQGRY